MKKRPGNTVKIVGRQWTLVLPAGPGYDREVMLDHLNEAVQRHGNAELVSANGRFSIAKTPPGSAQKCTSCRSAARGIAGHSGGNLLCLRCVLRRIRKRVRQPQLAFNSLRS